VLDFIEDTSAAIDALGYDEAFAQFSAVRRAVNLAQNAAGLTQEETILRFLVYANPALLEKAHTAIDTFKARCEKLFGSRKDWAEGSITSPETDAAAFGEQAA
jgi:hypothetical protein